MPFNKMKSKSKAFSSMLNEKRKSKESVIKSKGMKKRPIASAYKD